MSRAESNGGPYKVDCSGVVAKALKQIQKQANKEGRGKQVLSAVLQIWKRLTNDPMNFGEPLFRLPVLKMQVRHGAVRPLFVEFTVCEDKPLVFIKGVKLLPK